MATLCYKVIYRELGRVYNEGFVIAQIEGGKIAKLEGILTIDYLNAQIFEDYINIQIFKLCKADALGKFLEIPMAIEDFELPINMTASGIDPKVDKVVFIEIITEEQIWNQIEIQNYIKRLEEFRKNYVIL